MFVRARAGSGLDEGRADRGGAPTGRGGCWLIVRDTTGPPGEGARVGIGVVVRDATGEVGVGVRPSGLCELVIVRPSIGFCGVGVRPGFVRPGSGVVGARDSAGSSGGGIVRPVATRDGVIVGVAVRDGCGGVSAG